NVKNGILHVQYKRNSQIRNARNNRVTVYSSKIPKFFGFFQWINLQQRNHQGKQNICQCFFIGQNYT
ncbi:MAG: hypothetical protein ACN6PN_23725, partial [Sphingobacterium sp.]